MISPEVMQELLSVRQVLHYLPATPSTEKGWTPNEQQLFWVALTMYPQGPWTVIAEYIGTKSTRQAMTHGQKLRQKLKRWNNRLRRNPAASSLMDGVTVNTSADIAITADISLGTSPPSGFASSLDPNQYHDPQPASGFAFASSTMELDGGLMVDDVSIVSDFKMDGKDHRHHAFNTNSNAAAPAFSPTPDSTDQRHHYPAAAEALPPLGSRSSVPHLSAGATHAAEMMWSEETSETWSVTEFASDAEMLPQDLLDDLAGMLSDDDINELSHHHSGTHQPMC
ncbi:hypothetical protein BBJ28_00008296 [Nothophytophthora sp. Chile5]|nr:hypothetical protein BBJ28_00008296 [Nothophytophthora sp. Chile5]